jgi:hypothetical protein
MREIGQEVLCAARTDAKVLISGEAASVRVVPGSFIGAAVEATVPS